VELVSALDRCLKLADASVSFAKGVTIFEEAVPAADLNAFKK
jgi:hypothetical protein